MPHNQMSSFTRFVHRVAQTIALPGEQANTNDATSLHRHSSTPVQQPKRPKDNTLRLDDLIKPLVLAQATELARAGRYIESEQLLATIQDGQEIPAVLDLQARICAQQGRSREARTYWQRLLQLDPTDGAAIMGLLRLTLPHVRLVDPFSSRSARIVTELNKDQLLLAQWKNNQWHYEIVPNSLLRNRGTGGSHDYLVYRLILQLGPYIETHHLGVITLSQTGYNVTFPDEQETVWVPDLAFVRAERIPSTAALTWNRPWELVPDLIVEVASKDQRKSEIVQRAYGWLERGAHIIWILHEESQTVDVWSKGGEKPTTLGLESALDGRDIIPDFTCPLAHIFNPPHFDSSL